MIWKHLTVLLLAIVSALPTNQAGENSNDLEIPLELDNQFPPDNKTDFETENTNTVEEPTVADNEFNTSAIDTSVAVEDTTISFVPPAILDESTTITDEPSIIMDETTTIMDELTMTDEPSPIEEDFTTTEKENLEIPIAAVSDTNEELQCPETCVCTREGDDFFTDCKDKDLVELPKRIDVKTTVLNLNNNKLQSITTEISKLNDLKILQLDNNEISSVELGSISNLKQLSTLTLSNNALAEYPEDLKQCISLEVLTLNGNSLAITEDLFLSLTSLNNLTTPEIPFSLVKSLCSKLDESLASLCVNSCHTEEYLCDSIDDYIPKNMEPEEATLPSVILQNRILIDDIPDVTTVPETNIDNIVANDTTETIQDFVETTLQPNVNVDFDPFEAKLPATLDSIDKIDNDAVLDSNQNLVPTPILPSDIIDETNIAPLNEFSLRAAINQAPQEIATLNNIVDDPKNKEVEVNVGAATESTNTSRVDKSVIGMVVAGMVLIVAGVAIKKNWSSISQKCRSNPRPANNRASQANGTTQEELPLKENSDKSPV